MYLLRFDMAFKFSSAGDSFKSVADIACGIAINILTYKSEDGKFNSKWNG